MNAEQRQAYDDLPFVKYGQMSARIIDRLPQQRLSAIIAKRALVAAYSEENEPETCIVDLLADLRHLCDALGYLDFAELDKKAYDHYAAEQIDRQLELNARRKRKGAKRCGGK